MKSTYRHPPRSGRHLDHVVFPLGGIGSGMVGFEGTGAFSNVSVRHRPYLDHEPRMFAAVSLGRDGLGARVLEGAVPMRKILDSPTTPGFDEPGNGLMHRTYGLPRFERAEFCAEFPFAEVRLTDRDFPLSASVEAWSPFVPGDEDASSLPVAAVEYTLKNRGAKPLDAVFSFHSENFMAVDRKSSCVARIDGGFAMRQAPRRGRPEDEGSFAIFTDAADAAVDLAWFRGGWFDGMTDVWKRVEAGAAEERPPHESGTPSPGASLYVPVHIPGRRSVRVRIMMAWHVPCAKLSAYYEPRPPGPEPFLADGWKWSAIGVGTGLSTWHAPCDSKNSRWQPLRVNSDALLSLESLGLSDGLVCLKREWHQLEEAAHDLHIGHDGGMRVILNGEPLAHVPDDVAPLKPSRTILPVHLPKGKNSLCLILDRTGGTGAFVSLQPPPRDFDPAEPPFGYFVPWYVRRFKSLDALIKAWSDGYETLRRRSETFRECFFDSTLPPEIIEAVAANLSILKSPTCLRLADGTLWGWEGIHSWRGSCFGTCTHVWNYAQSIPHLFPALERTLRETEFRIDLDRDGRQRFRTTLPPGLQDPPQIPAADGQLGGLIKLHREWRISGNTNWLRGLWPAARRSMEFCIREWDPERCGLLTAPHHNTYDIEFHGPNSMCSGTYHAALEAMIAMGGALGRKVDPYRDLLAKGRKAMSRELWNGEWFIQRIRIGPMSSDSPSPEELEIIRREGPKYQMGEGCASEGVVGDWMARCSGLPPVFSEAQLGRHLGSVFRHNFRRDLRGHANTQRPGYAMPGEGGLLLCSWPRGGKPLFPFIYSDEVWTGVEYHVAAHLAMIGQADAGLEIVRTLRARYDGRWRNPFDEYECGHWYARAMSSYSLLQAWSGATYDAVTHTLRIHPSVPGDFRAFFSTAGGYGTVGVRQGKPFLEVRSGSIPCRKIVFKPRKNPR